MLTCTHVRRCKRFADTHARTQASMHLLTNARMHQGIHPDEQKGTSTEASSLSAFLISCSTFSFHCYFTPVLEFSSETDFTVTLPLCLNFQVTEIDTFLIESSKKVWRRLVAACCSKNPPPFCDDVQAFQLPFNSS